MRSRDIEHAEDAPVVRVEAELRLRNGHIRDALASRGWTNADLARATGCDAGVIGDLVNMKLEKFSWDLRIGKTATKVCEVLCLLPEDVVPPSIVGRNVEMAVAIGHVGLAQIESMSAGRLLVKDHNEDSIDDMLDAKQRVQEVLARLSPIQASVLRARFGIGETHETLSGTAKRLRGVYGYMPSRERVRQIELSAIWTARHALRAMASERKIDGFREVDDAPPEFDEEHTPTS